MREPRSRDASTRRWFRLARLALAGLTLGAALAGCGQSKSGSGTAASSNAGGAGATPPVATAARPESAGAPAVETTPPAERGGSATDLGAQVFAKRCVLCHGVDGHGDGIASKGLNPKPRNFHDQAYMKTRTDAQLLEVIHKGKGAMPRWEGQLSEAEIHAVLAHVRALSARQ